MLTNPILNTAIKYSNRNINSHVIVLFFKTWGCLLKRCHTHRKNPQNKYKQTTNNNTSLIFCASTEKFGWSLLEVTLLWGSSHSSWRNELWHRNAWDIRLWWVAKLNVPRPDWRTRWLASRPGGFYFLQGPSCVSNNETALDLFF